MLRGTSLVIQWLRFCTSNTGCAGSIPGLGTKIPYAMLLLLLRSRFSRVRLCGTP